MLLNDTVHLSTFRVDFASLSNDEELCSTYSYLNILQDAVLSRRLKPKQQVRLGATGMQSFHYLLLKS